MRFPIPLRVRWTALLLALTFACMSPALAKPRFTKIFDGSTLNGWKLINPSGRGYIVENGELVCPADGGGNLFTEKEYSDFILKFEFKLSAGGNNGVGLRAPLSGDAAYVGMESQVLDDEAPQYKDKLEPGQYHGSIYKVLPAKRGSLKPAGEWNREEIHVVGRKVKVILNGKVIVDGDLNSVTDAKTLAEHPGILRGSGHIGFLGHGTDVRFRKIEVADVAKVSKDNVAPEGFTALFNGKDLAGWKGLVGNPITRSKMTAAELTDKQRQATAEALKHWSVKDGAIQYDGKNDSLCTVKDYADFEMHVSWKIGPHGDSGIYLRGSPQVQIWDPEQHKLGSGGLYNNQKNPSGPRVLADKAIGEWNDFRILMIGERVTIYLNNQLVVQNVVLENYWDRNQPIFPTGQLELQHHGDHLEFKNIYVREIPRN
ncbi:MAG: 3-keto-disaccharide hydrolase [Armatimonadaceae bacterium]